MGSKFGDNPVLSTTLKTFQSATSGGKGYSRGELQEIDWAIFNWDSHASYSRDPSMRKVSIQVIMQACQRWQAAKAAKHANAPTSLLSKRWTAVQSLLTELGDMYRFQAYMEKKTRGGPIDSDLKGMRGIYEYEAPDVKRTPHVSASDVKLHGAKALGHAIATKADYQQAEALLRQSGAQLQVYLTRAQRLEYILLPINGRLMKDPFTPAHIPAYENWGIIKGGGPYAVDCYGNFFSIDERDLGKDVNGATKWNHSSFLRGKDVVCAGMFAVEQGKPKYISNESGHYAPSVDHLRNAVCVLVGNGIDVSSMFVRAFDFLPKPTDEQRAFCEDHSKLSDCKKATSAFGKMVEHSDGASFLGDPKGGRFSVSPAAQRHRLGTQAQGKNSKWYYAHLA
jgi:hypothetical protein